MKLKMFLSRFILAACFVFIGAVSSAQAQMPEGCSPDFRGVQENIARAAVIVDDAEQKQIIKQPDSVLLLSCFDQAMMESAKAGNIFSDTVPSGTMPSWASLAGIGLGILGIDGGFGRGTTSTLVEQVGSVVDPIFNDFVGNILGSFLTAGLSAITNFITTSLGGFLGSIPGLSGLLASILGQSMNCDLANDTWQNQIIGQGITADIPPRGFRDILQNPGAAIWGQAARDTLAANAGDLTNALNDLNDLQVPLSFDFNEPVPIFAPNALPADVIAQF